MFFFPEQDFSLKSCLYCLASASLTHLLFTKLQVWIHMLGCY